MERVPTESRRVSAQENRKLIGFFLSNLRGCEKIEEWRRENSQPESRVVRRLCLNAGNFKQRPACGLRVLPP